MKNKVIKLVIFFLAFGYVGLNWANSIAEHSVEIDKNVEMNSSKDESKTAHITAGHAKALRALDKEKYQENNVKTILIQVEKLTDNQGNSYLGGIVNQADIAQYLAKMQIILGDKFNEFRLAQRQRDHGEFHVTVVNPIEYQALSESQREINATLRVQLQGLGRVSKGSHTSYFVVASSSDGQFLRQGLLLQAKDFHVTLGFYQQDIYDIAKDSSTLIK